MTHEDRVGPLDFTDEEWSEYQAIPEQGYSHRHWLNARNQRRLEALGSVPEAVREAEARYRGPRMNVGTASDREIEAFVAGATWAMDQVNRAEGDGKAATHG